MTQKLKQNPLIRTARRLGQVLAVSLLTLGLSQSLASADDAEMGLPSGSGMQNSDLNSIRGQGVDQPQRPKVDWGVILWDEDGQDRSGTPGSRDSAVYIRIEIGTQP